MKTSYRIRALSILIGRRNARRLRILECALLILGFIALPPSPSAGQVQNPNLDKPYLIPEANRLPDANDQIRLREQQNKKTNFEAANIERKRQLTEDAARLVELAQELKSEVDKTDKDTLSLTVMRKAEIIEKLARGVREKMKLTVGGD